ncbi:MAG: ATP-binding protein [Acidimicrobiia bacterium]|nr:ATP-binding protein [Acidimicrobiia bacterium]
MTRRILLATGVVVAITLLVGVGTALAVRARVQSSAEVELARQARVTAELIDEDLSDVRFRRGGDVAAQLARYRNTLERSLERARILGGHDVVEAILTVRGNDVPISEPLVVLPSVPASARPGDVATVDVEGTPMAVVVERVDLPTGALTVAIGRTQQLFPSRVVIWSLLLALGVGATLTLALGAWLSRSLSLRLASIGDAAERIGEGDLSARAAREGDDEIGKVAEAFNDMAEDLESTRERERQFLMAVGHDLRTPLTTIRGYAEALDAGDVSTDKMPEVAAALHRQTDQLSRLIEDVTLLARLEASEFTLRPEIVELSGLVAEIAESYRHRSTAASIEITTVTDGTGVVHVDPDRLRQVIGNLMDNALRYTPDGGTITVTVGDGDVPEVSVANTGAGIRTSDIPYVFDRLYVADRYRAERPSGSGLGLAIVKELVDAMGGTVTCTSSSRLGTVFTIRLQPAEPA